MKKTVIIVLSLFLLCSLAGCKQQAEDSFCRHEWKRVENYNEYTAMDRCGKCGVTRLYIDPDNVPYAPGYEAGFFMKQYAWDGYGISQKSVFACDLGYAVLGALESLTETGETVPKVGDDRAVDENTGELPADPGTMWLECGSVGLFRVSPDRTQICKVESHLGEGKALEMTDTLKSLLEQAWYYYPYDCWEGTVRDGSTTLNQVFKSDSVVDFVHIESLRIEKEGDPHNQMTLVISAKEDREVTVSLKSYASGDNFAAGDFKTVKLKKDAETSVDLSFGGFSNTRYYLTILMDNTRVSLTIEP